MSYLNDYIKPTDYGAVRKDINRILSLIHDITAQEPEDEGLQERITISSNVKLRTSTATTGGTTRTNTDDKDVEIFAFRKSIPSQISAYPLTHTDNGTLTFDVSGTKFGGAVTLDGSSYVSVAHDSSLNVTDAISLGGWFYLPATDGTDTTSQTLIDKDVWYIKVDPHSVAPNQVRVSVAVQGDDDLTTEAGVDLAAEDNVTLIGESIIIDRDTTGTFTPDAWNHIWVTWGSPNIQLYIDKVLTNTNSSASGVLNTNSNGITLG
jgi:hypothetical protein